MNEGTAAIEESLVSTDGGRYDVDVGRRERTAVYWEEAPSTVRRCSWFFKGSLETRYTPYDEDMAEKLEEEYQKTILLRWANVYFPFSIHFQLLVYHSSNRFILLNCSKSLIKRSNCPCVHNTSCVIYYFQSNLIACVSLFYRSISQFLYFI